MGTFLFLAPCFNRTNSSDGALCFDNGKRRPIEGHLFARSEDPTSAFSGGDFQPPARSRPNRGNWKQFAPSLMVPPAPGRVKVIAEKTSSLRTPRPLQRVLVPGNTGASHIRARSSPLVSIDKLDTMYRQLNAFSAIFRRFCVFPTVILSSIAGGCTSIRKSKSRLRTIRIEASRFSPVALGKTWRTSLS